MKKIISLVLSAVIMLSALCGLNISAYATSTQKLSDSIFVSYDETSKTLTVYGEGRMNDYESCPLTLNIDFSSKIVISEGITYIGANAFNIVGVMEPKRFIEVEIAASVKEIGADAFRGTAISSFNLSKNVELLGARALCTVYDGSSKGFTTAINVDAENPYFSSLDGILYNKNKTELIQVPAKYSFTDGDFTVLSSVEKISSEAFYKCTGLKTITFPESLSSIGENAFTGCSNLTSATFIGKGALTVGANAFRNHKFNSTTQEHTYPLINESLTLYVPCNSGAEEFAKADGINFENTSEPKNGWEKIDGYWYYFVDDVKQTGWQKIDGLWYYMNGEGKMLTGWQKIGGVWYYLKSGGAMVTGWQKIGGIWYYFKSGGAMVTGWQKISNKWYYFKSGGAMVTGWIKLSGKWYYLEPSGAMRTANLRYKGKIYRFNKSGVCLNP